MSAPAPSGPPFQLMFKRIAIIGSGAIGTYYGARLQRAGAEVHFLMRSDREHVRAHGIELVEARQTLRVQPVTAVATTEEIGPVDLVIVALKTTANGDLPRLLPPLLGSATAVLTLQNGLGSDEEIARIVGAERVLGGLCFIAATRIAPGTIRCFHPGSITLGEFGRPLSDRARALAAQWEAAGLKCRAVDNLAEARWRKLVWNVPFNGLSIAAGGITTDIICADTSLAAEVRALMAEVVGAAERLGFTVPPSFVEQQFNVTPPMGPYQPSSLVDFLAGREVEVEAIWGEPLRRAQAAGVAMPRLELLYALLKRVTRPRTTT